MTDGLTDWQHVIELQAFPGVVRSHFAMAFLPVEERRNHLERWD